MILLQFIFLLYWKLLCNSTELLQNKGFIISSEEPSSVIFSHVVTQYSQCILCLLLVFDIFQIMTVVKKKKKKWQDISGAVCMNHLALISFRLIMPFSL